MTLYIVLAIAVIAILVGWKVLLERKTKKEMGLYKSIPPVAPTMPPIAPKEETANR